jgi:uncharacterized membrane protein YcaP (DUF421 family)
MNSLFHFDVGPMNLLIRAIAVYLSVLFLLRVGGKRQMGQLSATEFVAVLLISNAVQNSMNGGDNSLIGGLWLAVVLIATSTGVTFVTYRSRFFRRLFEGTPTLVIHHGKVVEKSLRREMVTLEELKAMLRRQGFHALKEINNAILEADGTLTIIKADAEARTVTQP